LLCPPPSLAPIQARVCSLHRGLVIKSGDLGSCPRPGTSQLWGLSNWLTFARSQLPYLRVTPPALPTLQALEEQARILV
jgi:hypothetical protein